VDPFSPFITFLLSHHHYLAAIALALVALAAIVALQRLSGRGGPRGDATSASAKGGPGSQNTVVSNVRSDGDVTVSPEQHNG
jgi:hypothetical protein